MQKPFKKPSPRSAKKSTKAPAATTVKTIPVDNKKIASFSELTLPPVILKGLQACNYTTPTPVQAAAIPLILDSNQDVIVTAPTGTGKTAAFVIPALALLAEQKNLGVPRILVLTPTRELAMQIVKAVKKYGKFMRLRLAECVGGMSYFPQIKDLQRGADIIIATPGRLLDHVKNKKVNLSEIAMLVLDEADRMLDMGFIDDIKEIIQQTPSSRQTLLFSATIDKQMEGLKQQYFHDPVHIDISQQNIASENVKQSLYLADNRQHKMDLLQHFLDEVNLFKTVIFSATKSNADHLAAFLRSAGHEAEALHGDMKQGARNRTLAKFRSGRLQFLVATDVASRGIDVPDISHVINFDLPKFHEDYVHRIGRTGRAGKKGEAISLYLPAEQHQIRRIENYLRIKLVQEVVAGLEPKPIFEKRSNKKTAAGKPGKKSFHQGFKKKTFAHSSKPKKAFRPKKTSHSS